VSDNPRKAPDAEVNEVADGYVVYHPSRDRVHYLNHTAALVLEFCTGENSEDAIVRLLQKAYDLPEPPTAEVRDCLEQLRGEGLVV
jgi:hypothetical protein